MKILKKELIGILFFCFLFTFGTAKAEPIDNQRIFAAPDADSRVHGERKIIEFRGDQGEKGGSGSNASLPINNQVWFLLIAAVGIGCKVIIKKGKHNIVQLSN